MILTEKENTILKDLQTQERSVWNTTTCVLPQQKTAA